MSNHAYIKLVKASKQQEITLEELKEFFLYYKDITGKTGEQLDWEYKESAFPYTIAEVPEGEGKWFYLKGTADRYKYIVVGIGEEEIEQEDGTFEKQAYIQIILPEGATHGDKGKANEFCKFLGKKYEGELHLFNGRVMYFYKRK